MERKKEKDLRHYCANVFDTITEKSNQKRKRLLTKLLFVQDTPIRTFCGKNENNLQANEA